MDWNTPGLPIAITIFILSTLASLCTARISDCALYPSQPGGKISGCLSQTCLQTVQGFIWPSSCVCSASKCQDDTYQQTKHLEGRQAQLPMPQNAFDLIRNMQIMITNMRNLDTNECQTGTAQCAQICVNTFGSYACSCRDGFTLSEDGKSCFDVNECITGQHQCSQGCINVLGSYRCSCSSPAFQLSTDGKTCYDVNECLTGQHSCRGGMRSCVNTFGSYRCSCPDGFQLSSDGSSCQDENECVSNSHGCDQQCVNTIGSYQCRCNAGYELLSDARTCASGAVIENNNIV